MQWGVAQLLCETNHQVTLYLGLLTERLHAWQSLSNHAPWSLTMTLIRSFEQQVELLHEILENLAVKELLNNDIPGWVHACYSALQSYVSDANGSF